MATPLVHIGYHKTGTKWLQRHLFDCRAAGFITPPRARKEIHERLVYPHPLDFDAAACRVFFAELLAATPQEGRVPVLSSEALCGSLFAGAFDSRELADRLAMVVPGSRILILIREQKDMIYSSYRQYIKAGGPCTLDRLLRPPLDRGTRVGQLDIEHFKYDRLIAHYQRLFGPDRVLVRPYELFREDPEALAREIVRFAGTDAPDAAIARLPFTTYENESIAGAAVAVKRRLNYWIRDHLNPWARWPMPGSKAALVRWSQRLGALAPEFVSLAIEERARRLVAERAGARFQESNRLTTQLTGVDLRTHGYDV